MLGCDGGAEKEARMDLLSPNFVPGETTQGQPPHLHILLLNPWAAAFGCDRCPSPSLFLLSPSGAVCLSVCPGAVCWLLPEAPTPGAAGTEELSGCDISLLLWQRDPTERSEGTT